MKIIKSNIFIYLYVLICFLASCKKFNTVVDLDIPEQKKVVVLNSLFTNDSVLCVRISKSADFFKKETPANVTDAECKLYVNGTFYENLTNNGNGLYTSSLLPASGNTYEVKASVSGYEEVSGKATMPPAVILNENKTYVDSINKLFYYSFRDTDNGNNYYSISLLVFEVDSVDNIVSQNLAFLAPNNQSPLNIFGDEGPVAEYFFDDVLYNGGEFNGSLKVEDYYYDYDSETPRDSGYVPPRVLYVAVLKNISEDMYKYKKSLSKQQQNSSNPFAEPVLVFNNIINGFGIFAGYSFDVKEVQRR